MKTLLFLPALLGICLQAFCQRNLLTAVKSGNWNQADNWIPARLPADNDSIYIPPNIKITLGESKAYNNTYLCVAGELLLNEPQTGSFWLDLVTTNTIAGNQVVWLPNKDARIGRGLNQAGEAGLRVRVNGTGDYIVKYRVGDEPLHGAAIAFNNNNSNFSIAAEASSALILVRFSLQQASQAIRLEWSAQDETNGDQYELERSPDARNWNKLQTIAARNDGQKGFLYQYSDNQPLIGISYYRIRIVDQDGSFALSPIRSARFGGEGNSVSLYPNPATSQATLYLPFGTSEPSSLSLYSHNGHLYRQLQLPAGTCLVNLPVQKLPAGDYLVLVKQANGNRHFARLLVYH